MRRRLHLPLSCQTLIGGLAGAIFGTWLESWPASPLTFFCRQLADLAGSLFSIWAQALAVPLIFTSIVLGTAGLEPMRALGRITSRTIFWMMGSSLLAILVGLGAAFTLATPDTHEWTSQVAAGAPQISPMSVLPSAPWGWVALVLVSLGFAYYRNQLEDGHARLIARLCQGVSEMLLPLLTWMSRLAPWGIFALLTIYTSGHSPGLLGQAPDLWWYPVKALLLSWATFGLLVLPAALWTLARINPWRYFAAMLPAMLMAFASGSPEKALPMTMRGARSEAHISNRVAGPVLSLCAVFQREGLAMGGVVISVCHWRMFGPPENGRFWLAVVLTGWLSALGGAALRPGMGVAPLFLFGLMGLRDEGVGLGWMTGGFVVMGGAAVSVLSHACAAAIIARGEGEYWVPGPPPSADELQGLKTDLESAEG